ncbi:MAG: hypothetical protein COB36_00005, partial [Alphaproteobacteria bacterium]
VEPSTIHVNSIENNFGNALDVKLIEPKLKQSLSSKGFDFSDNDQNSFDSTPLVPQSKNMPEDLLSKKETLDLIRTYYSVEDPKIRRDILKFVKSMAKNIT